MISQLHSYVELIASKDFGYVLKGQVLRVKNWWAWDIVELTDGHLYPAEYIETANWGALYIIGV